MRSWGTATTCTKFQKENHLRMPTQHWQESFKTYALPIDLNDSMTDSNTSTFCDSTTKKAANLCKLRKLNSHLWKQGVTTYHAILDAETKLIFGVWSLYFDFHHRGTRDNGELDCSLIFSVLNMKKCRKWKTK